MRLNWRVSNPKSPKYSLGWIPFKGGHAKYKSGQIEFAGKKFSLWDSYGLGKYELRGGSFSQDARGRWYFNVAVEVDAKPSAGTTAVGIDLGLKECATTSTGEKLEGRWYRAYEQALVAGQRQVVDLEPSGVLQPIDRCLFGAEVSPQAGVQVESLESSIRAVVDSLRGLRSERIRQFSLRGC